ncbi:MAG: hypothetical protein U0269_31230 [Polyangiales bacterium]
MASAQTQAPPPPDNSGSASVQGSVTIGASTSGNTMAPVQVQPPAQCSSASDSLYNEGMNRMAAGDDAGAATLFGRVLELCPSHPTAAEMRRNAEQHAQARAGGATVGAGGAAVQPAGGVAVGNPAQGTITVEGQGGMSFLAPVPNYNLVYGPDPVTLGARLNLVIGQTLFGMSLGSFVPLMIAGNSIRAEHIAGGILLGGALGAAGSLVASLNGVTQGQAIAVNFGSGAGLGLGFSVAALAGLRDMQLSFGLIAAGQALGTAAGAIIALQRPLSGKMSYISSLAGWGAMATWHVYAGVTNLGAGTSIEAMGGVLLGGLAAGTLAGALTAPFVHVSADRMGWIDLSMAAGWLVVGSSAGLFAASSGSGGIAYAWGSIAGVGLGALFGILITRDSDRYWHQAREQQLQQAQGAQGRQARLRPTQQPSVHFAPGGPGNTPMGFTLAGTF